MIDLAILEALFAEHGFEDFRWIKPQKMIVAQWVRMKCTFGCGNYGKNASCPPNVPTVAECRQFFDDYEAAVVFHFQKRLDHPEDRHLWSRGVNEELLKLERTVFLSGYAKAFLLFMDSCYLCDDCPGVRKKCRHPRSSRPSPESMAVDVFSTVRQYGYPIDILSDYSKAMNRYAFLLIE
jgi:predicted metal-binding protein